MKGETRDKLCCRRRSCRAYDEINGKTLSWWHCYALTQQHEEELNGPCTTLEEGLAYRGEAKVLSDVDIVKADDGECSRNGDVSITSRLQNTHRLGVARCKDCRRWIR